MLPARHLPLSILLQRNHLPLQQRRDVIMLNLLPKDLNLKQKSLRRRNVERMKVAKPLLLKRKQKQAAAAAQAQAQSQNAQTNNSQPNAWTQLDEAASRLEAKKAANVHDKYQAERNANAEHNIIKTKALTNAPTI